jgi:hypothetical protein
MTPATLPSGAKRNRWTSAVLGSLALLLALVRLYMERGPALGAFGALAFAISLSLPAGSRSVHCGLTSSWYPYLADEAPTLATEDPSGWLYAWVVSAERYILLSFTAPTVNTSAGCPSTASGRSVADADDDLGTATPMRQGIPAGEPWVIVASLIARTMIRALIRHSFPRGLTCASVRIS